MSPYYWLRISVAMMAICSVAPAPILVAYAQSPSVPQPAWLQSALTQSPETASGGNIGQSSAVLVPATIQAFFVTDLYAKVSGYVSQINNDIGDRVRKGQALAIIANPELQAQFDKAARKGIILLHDPKAQTAAMLPAFLRYLRDNGYRVVHLVPTGPGVDFDGVP